MSKIGRAPITIPSSVTVTINGSVVSVKAGSNELTHTIPSKIKAELHDQELLITRTSEDKPTRALHGLTRAILANMVLGVTQGFKKTLELIGTGYRARLAGNKLILSLGFSHEVEYLIPAGLNITVEGTNFIHISGADKHAVGQAAANIRAYKQPEPYKGKGIKYSDEVIRRKAGKAAKAGA